MHEQVLVPEAHLPLLQRSPTVQGLSSLHAPVALLCWQPPTGSQVSAVQPLLSSQYAAGVTGKPLHAAAAQTSLIVQAFPSTHGSVFGAKTHPEAVLHVSLVHTLPSSHVTKLPTQPPMALHTSPWLHALPSLHEAPGWAT